MTSFGTKTQVLLSSSAGASFIFTAELLLILGTLVKGALTQP